MSYCFSIAACICGFISSGFWFYASLAKFKIKTPWMKMISMDKPNEKGSGIPNENDINNFLKQNGRINAMAAGFTGLASLFSALSILLH